MHIRSKTYLQMLARLRALGHSMSHVSEPASQEASPSLIFVVVGLTLMLAMLEADLHSAELHALGLFGFPIDEPIFCGP